MIRAKVIPGTATLTPFVIIDSLWDKTGHVVVHWHTTPEELERLARELRQASKEGRNGQQTQEVSRPPEQGAALESMDAG